MNQRTSQGRSRMVGRREVEHSVFATKRWCGSPCAYGRSLHLAYWCLGCVTGIAHVTERLCRFGFGCAMDGGICF
jgi:hypothetical protein